MSSRRPSSGQWGRNAPMRGGRYASQYEEEERSYRSNGVPRRGGPASGAGREFSEYEENGDFYRSSHYPRARGGRQPDRRPSRGQGPQREPFFAAREKKSYGATEGGSNIARLLQSAEKELVGWLRSEGRVASMISKVMKIMESIEEKLRTESYNGYTGSVWEADDPISGVINEKSQELLFRLRKLTELLDVPTEEVADDMAEGFYLLFSAMHVLLSHPDTPDFCRAQISRAMSSAAAIAMKNGDPHILLNCTTDHLRESENEIVLLAFQHVLYEIIESDVDGQKLFGTAHRILDAQMDILETRDDEDTAVSAINIIGIISLRHPQAFKTRFWDLMDLLIGWYVDATPSDRVFDVCLVAFGLFREKFKQEIDYAWKMAKEFTQEMEAAVKAYHKTDQNSIDLEQRGIFLAFFQLYALILHSVSERIANANRNPTETSTRQAVKSTMTTILKSFNQVLRSSDPGFVIFSTRVNKALVVVVDAIGAECVPVGSLLYLHTRMQQTSAQRIYNLSSLHADFVKSIFKVVAATLRVTREYFPLDAAKDLLGPESLVFGFAGDQEFLAELRTVMEALITCSQTAVRDIFLKSFRNYYRRHIRIIADLFGKPSLHDHLMSPSNSMDGKRRNSTRRVAGNSVSRQFEPLEIPTGEDFGEPLATLCSENLLHLFPEGTEDAPAKENIRGVLNFETIGQNSRKRILVYLFLVEICLKDLPNAEAVSLEQEFVDGCFKVLVSEISTAWMDKFPELVIAHVFVARILWQKKCTTLAVKDLMSAVRSTVGITALDRDLIRSTLNFLHTFLTARDFNVLLPLALDWSSHALKTLIAFSTSLADLGIEAEYFKLFADFVFFTFCGDDRTKKVVVETLTDLYRSHGIILRKTVTVDVLELMMGLNSSPSEHCTALAEMLISGASLQTVLMYKYDFRQENPALLQMEMAQILPGSTSTLPLSMDKFPNSFLGEREASSLPFQRNQRLWKSFLSRNFGLGSGDFQLVGTLLRTILCTRSPRIYDEVKQILESAYDLPEWMSAVISSTPVAFFAIVSDIASSICHQKLSGLLSDLDDSLLLIESLVQTYAPIPCDHMSFIHKSLLDLYIHMKDASLDVSEDWEDIRRLADETGADLDVVQLTNVKKTLEKRRIYTRLGGITANDVSVGSPLSWVDVRLQQRKILLFAEALEHNLNRMIRGSALYLMCLSDEDWRKHAKIVGAAYGSEEQISKAILNLKSLRTQMLRLAVDLEDDYAIVRLGYPVMLNMLREGKVERVNMEKLSSSLLFALIRLQSPHLITGLQAAQLVSEVESGISDSAFGAAADMSHQKYDHASENLQSIVGLQAQVHSRNLEHELAVDCFLKLNDWDGLMKLLTANDNISQRGKELLLLSRFQNFDVGSMPVNMDERTLIFHSLRGGIQSRKNGAEISAFVCSQHSQYDVAREAVVSLRAVEKVNVTNDIPKFDGRAAVLRHVLERLVSGDGQGNQTAAFPMDSDRSLDLKYLDIETLHTLSRFSIGGEGEAGKYCRALVKFGRRTENRSMTHRLLTGYFTKRIPDFGATGPDDMDDTGAFLTNMLLLASNSAVHIDDIRLVRQGAKCLAERQYGQAVDGALSVSKQACFDAFRLMHESPEDAGACLVEVSKNIGFLDFLHSSFTGNGEFQENLTNAIADLRFPLESLFDQSGSPLEMFVENHRRSRLLEPNEFTSGVLAEMGYMLHCLEGTYAKPALDFANWCYEEAHRMLLSLSKINFAELVAILDSDYPDQDHSALTPVVVSRVVQLFLDSLPIRASRQEIKAVLELMRGELPDVFVTIFEDDYLKEHACPASAVSSVLSYCQKQFCEIVEFFTQACHIYFIYLRNPARDDLTAVVILRLIEILTAFPDPIGAIWMEELAKHDVVVWRGFLTQLFARIYHPHPAVVDCVIEVIVALTHRFPNDVIYPAVVGHMFAHGRNIGGGVCCPNMTFAQRAQMRASYDRLMERLIPLYGPVVAAAVGFATEIQRLSLLWEERWLQFLLSHQGLIKKELKLAIRDASETVTVTGLHRTLSEDSLDDSAAEDLAFPASYSIDDLNLGSIMKSQNGNLEEFCVDEIDIEGLKRQNSDLVVRSRNATPEIPDAQKEDALDDDLRKESKKFVRFPVHENIPWKTRFNKDIYKAAVEPVLQRLRTLLEFCARNPETSSELEFVNLFYHRLAEALEKIADPPISTEFDEEVLWAPFSQIIADLEKRQAAKRKTGVSLTDTSKLTQLLNQSANLPMPGWSNGPADVFIARIDDCVAILPTKTKPKKLAFWGTDGYKHSFLCKGLEDLTQDARIMQFLEVSNKFLKRRFKHSQSVDRARTYSVISFGPRAGLIQWVDGSTSLLSLYRSHLERETVLGRQIFATKEESFADLPAFVPAKIKENELSQMATFRVTEEELQDIYETVQAEKFGDLIPEPREIRRTVQELEMETDPFEKWMDSDEEFSPEQFTDLYYHTLIGKSKADLQHFHLPNQLPLRVHPHIHELYMSYLVKSLRKDTSIDWEKFRLHEKNYVREVSQEHLKSALSELTRKTPDDLLAREIEFACFSSEEWWMVSRGYLRSLAVSSVLGYITGLGDRHPDNILLDFHTGEVVHVDYNIAFEKGLRLSVPELVPYRLTQNLIRALGWEGTEGTFRDVAIETLETLRKNQPTLSNLMSGFLIDPLLDWTIDKSDVVGLNPATLDEDQRRKKGEKATAFGVKVWNRVREKLLGIDGPDNSRSSVPDQIDWTIATATDATNLARMFEGWVAWL